MTQPYDYWHVNNAGLSLGFNSREWMTPAVSSSQYWCGVLTARPFFVGDNGIKLNAVRLRMFDATRTGSCRIGIYACPPPQEHNMFPSSLIADFGDLNLNGTTLPVITAGAPVELGPGFYYVATRFRAAAAGFPPFGSVHGEGAVGGPGFPLGYDPFTGAGYIGFSAYCPTGPLPDPFPAICPRRYGVLQANSNPSTAIYMESAAQTTALVQVQWIYSAGHVGAPIRSTDIATQVSVTYGPGTLVADVVAAFMGGTPPNNHIVNAINVGETTTMPAFSTSLFQLQPGGPLQRSAALGIGFFPATSLEVVV